MSLELLTVVDSVSREKNLPRDELFAALEEILKNAAKKTYGSGDSLMVQIDRRTGEIQLSRRMLVVDGEHDDLSANEGSTAELILLSEAQQQNSEVKLGDYIYEPLPSIELDRSLAYWAKQMITEKVAKMERAKHCAEFEGRVGDIVQGIVCKVERDYIIVMVRGVEAILPRSQLLFNDHYRPDERIEALLTHVDKSGGTVLNLSRTNPTFVAKLFEQEVPEISEGLIQIKAIAREPGTRSKVAVYCEDPSIDAVGSCIGIRGARVQAVIEKLNGEKIDLVLWSEDRAQLVINALAPVQVLKIIIDEDKERIEVVVNDSSRSIAIGKRGDNIRLVSKLIGWNVSILTETEETGKRLKEFDEVTQLFMLALDVEEILAQLLISENYNSIQALASADVTQLGSIEGLDEDIAAELINRAKDYLANDYRPTVSESKIAHEDDSALPRILTALRKAGIRRLDDVADLSGDELEEILEHNGVSISRSIIDAVIMQVRKKTYFATQSPAESNKQ